MRLAEKITADDAAGNWSKIELLSASMSEAATSEDWPRVLELSTERHTKVMRHFELFPVGPENAEFYQQKLSMMLTSEQQLQAMTLEARKQLMRSGLTSARNHRAVGAYLAT